MQNTNKLTVRSHSMAGLNYELAIRPIIDGFPADPAIYIFLDQMEPERFELKSAHAADNLNEAIADFRGDYANASELPSHVAFISGPGSTKELRQCLADDLNKAAQIALTA